MLGLCSMAAILTLLACAWHCLSSLVFNAFLVFVFGAALYNAMILRMKAADGISLTSPPKQSSGPLLVSAPKYLQNRQARKCLSLLTSRKCNSMGDQRRTET